MMDEQVQLKQFKGKRGQIKSSLTRHLRFVSERVDKDNVSVEVKNEVRVRLEQLVPLLDQFNETQQDIESIVGVLEEEDQERDNFESLYFAIHAQLETILQMNFASDKQVTMLTDNAGSLSIPTENGNDCNSN